MQEISPIKQRILQYADTLKISKRDFYAKTGISRGTLESNTGITEETLAKFFAVYQEVNPGWILTGNGKHFIEAEDPPRVNELLNAKDGTCKDCKAKDELIASLRGQIKIQ